MNVLVTGATGFLGSHVARQLSAHGERVRVLARASSNRTALEGTGAEIVEGDLRNPASLETAMSGDSECFMSRRITGCGRAIRRRFTNRM